MKKTQTSYKGNGVYSIDSLLTDEESSTLKQLIDNLPASLLDLDSRYGRLKFHGLEIAQPIQDRLTKLVNETFNQDSELELELEMVYPSFGVEYSLKHGGSPNLPTHFDGDFNEVIITYQLDSNTQWPIGVDLALHPLTDNSAVMFNPNANIHWRPRKAFEDGEYVRMVFFRFFNPVNRSDYSYLPNHPQDAIFDEVNAYRDSLGLLEA